MSVTRTARRRKATAVPGETEIARAARQLALDVMRRVDRYAEQAESWWKAERPRTRVALAILAVIAAASVLNLIEVQLARGSMSQPPAQAAVAKRVVLSSESAPSDAGRTWAVVKMWQGSGARDTESFTVGEHWRVDWVFDQTQPTGQMQIYVDGADGKLLNIAANTQKSGSDTTFWMGPGTYTLHVVANGGDWKLAVQDLR